jgi:hypothetical protein
MNEVQPLQFGSAADAVRWADAYLARDGVKSQAGTIIKRAMERQGAGGVDSNGERITPSRLHDEAATISVILSGVANPAGNLYRHIYGRYPHTLDLADYLARLVWDGPGKCGRTLSSMRDLATLVIEDTRKRERDWGRLRIVQIADAMNITRDSYYSNYRRYADAIREHIQQVLQRVDSEVLAGLVERGIV